MKTCFKCNQFKPLSEYYKHPQMGDGTLNKCKECAKKDSDDNFKRKMQDPDWQIKERARQRAKEENRRQLGLVKKYNKSPVPKGQRKEKYGKYENAIRDGRLTRKPCEVCGKNETQGHHEDYAKPLDVVWLCTRHHSDRHIHLRNMQTLGRDPVEINQFIESLRDESIYTITLWRPN